MPEPESCRTFCRNCKSTRPWRLGLLAAPVAALVRAGALVFAVGLLPHELFGVPSPTRGHDSCRAELIGERCQTVFVADGSSAVFWLPEELTVIGTDTVHVDGRVLDRSRYLFDPAHGRVWLLTRPAAGAVITVTRRCLHFGGPSRARSASRNQPVPALQADSTVLAVIDTTGPGAGLELSGSKTVGVSFGGTEGSGIDQATRVALSGEVEGIRVEAELSDQSSPIPAEGTTRDIQELDRLLISLKARSWQGSFGDVDVSVPAGSFGRIERRAKGALVSGQTGGANVTVGYATPRGQFGRVSLLGTDGSQGPYLLAPNGQAATVVPGSEAVYLDGRRMTRGWDGDYTIDYAGGELVFTDRNIISHRSRIEATFQFAAGDYERTGAAVVADYRPALFDLGLGLFRENDNRSRNLALDLSPEEQDYLASIGQDTSRAWLPGETYVGSGNGSYVREADHFLYCPDSGDYNVQFTLVGDSVGDYVYNDTLFAYLYVGPGAGNYAARVRVRLPEQDELVYARVGLNAARLSTRVEGAFQRRNLNLFAPSPVGPGASGLNLSAAYQDSTWGFGYRRHMQGGGLALPGASPIVDFSYRWGGTTEDQRASSDELAAHARPWRFLEFAADAGRLARTDRRAVTRLGGSARLGWLQYEGAHAGQVTRHDVHAAPRLGPLLPRAGWQNEARPEERSRSWLAGLDLAVDSSTRRSVGRPAGGVSARLTEYEEPDSSRGAWNRTSRARLVQVTVGWKPLPALDLDGRAAHQDRRFLLSAQDDWHQLLGSIRATFAPRAGLRFMTDLGQSFRRVQLRDEFFRYVGPGQGTFRRDTVTGRYVSDPDGDYERVVITTGRTTAARTLSASASGEVSTARPAALSGSFSLNRAGTESGELSSDVRWDLRLSVRALEPAVNPILGANYLASHDRTLAATGLASARSIGYVELNSDWFRELQLRSCLEAGRAQRTLNSGLTDHEELHGKAEFNPVLGERLRLELTTGFERLLVAEPVTYPELGRFTLDVWRGGLARSTTIGSRTRIRTSIELVRRTASVPDLPYELALSSPTGLNPMLGLELSHSFSNVLNASARYGFSDRPDRPADHRFSSELRADF